MTISIKNNIKLSNISNTDYPTSILKLCKNRVFISYINLLNSNFYIHGLICDINEIDIIPKEDIQLGSCGQYSNSSGSLLRDKVFIGYASSMYPYGLVLDFTTCIQPVTTSADDIYGIAKANATEGQQVDVYRPYEEVVV